MKKSICTLLLIVIALYVNAQSYYEGFKSHLQKGDTTKQYEILQKWKKDSPKDAELFTCLFNYYFLISGKEIVVINAGKPPKGENAVALLSQGDDMVKGYIGSRIDYDKSNLKNAFESINKGIELYPDRLDMRFGKIYVLGQIKDWNSFTKEIITTVNYSAQNNNKWTWTLNEKKADGEKFFLACLQDYQSQLYNTMDDKLLVNMQEIAKAVLKHYPNHIESLSNLAVGYIIGKKFDKALVPLLKAEKINPEDFIVLNNIAFAYKEMGNKEKAMAYYKKVIKYGDAEAKMQAEEEIKKLNKK